MPQADLPKPLILIADDDRTLRKLLNLALVQAGYQVIQVGSGEQVIQDFQRLQPNLVLLDAMMPDVDGFECCKHLRHVFNTDIPILIVTVLDDQSSIDRAFEVGATDYITKPIHWAVLRQRVKRLLSSSLAIQSTQQAQLKEEKAQVWETLQRKLLSRLNMKIPFPQFLDQTMEPLKQVFGAEQIWVQDVNHQKLLLLETLEDYPESEVILELLAKLTPIANQSVFYSKALEDSDSLNSDGQNSKKVAKAIAEKLNTQTLLLAPILRNHDFLGWLMISTSADQPDNDLRLQRSLDMATWIAIALS